MPLREKWQSLLIAVFVVSLTGLFGCDQLTNPPSPQTTKVAPQKSTGGDREPVHRFVLAQHDYDVAFDTQTGQICRTWDWQVAGKPPSIESGVVPQRQFGELAPTCLSLYLQYRSTGTSQAESTSDNQSNPQ